MPQLQLQLYSSRLSIKLKNQDIAVYKEGSADSSRLPIQTIGYVTNTVMVHVNVIVYNESLISHAL